VWRTREVVGFVGVAGDALVAVDRGGIVTVDLATGDLQDELTPTSGYLTWRDGDVLAVWGGDHAYIVDLATGEALWDVEAREAPGLGSGVLAVADEPGDSGVVGYDLRTGDELWTADGDVAEELWIEDGLVLWSDADGSLHAVDAGTGERQWTTDAATARPPGQRSTGGNVLAPAPDDGIVLAAGDGELFALDADDGAERWSVGPWDERNGEAFVLDGTVVAVLGLFEEDAPIPNVVGLDPEQGEERWRVEGREAVSPPESPSQVNVEDAVVDLATGTVTPTPLGSRTVAATGEMVLVQAADGLEGLVALDAGSGEERWSVDGEFGTATIVGDIVVTANLDGDLVGLAVEDGEQRWALDSGIPIPILFPTASGVVVAGSSSAEIALIR
jgi:outer membrane protein assembly factor BamB